MNVIQSPTELPIMKSYPSQLHERFNLKQICFNSIEVQFYIMCYCNNELMLLLTLCETRNDFFKINMTIKIALNI